MSHSVRSCNIAFHILNPATSKGTPTLVNIKPIAPYDQIKHLLLPPLCLKEVFAMPAISMFYGIIIRMLFMDTQQHHLPHLHVEYQEVQAVISIPDGKLLGGELPAKKLKLTQVWVDIHEEE